MTEKLIKRANELLNKKERYKLYLTFIEGKQPRELPIDFIINCIEKEEREKIKNFIKTILLKSIDEMEKELKEI